METGNNFLTSPVPPCDMYGERIIEFTADEDKNYAREKYLKSVIDNLFFYDEKVLNLHKRKAFYYVNKNIIGYSLLAKEENRKGQIIKYYTLHEINRKNIKDISYDTEYGEYIIHLYTPVYVDYTMSPSTEFRIQDIFDDTKLTIALKLNLPPKNMMY